MKRILPVLALFFLSPAIAELLSGSTPPMEFFNPFVLLVLSAFYGSGAILVRELALRWHKRWPTILVLGMAYGIIEEGLMIKSFFDPNWPDLDILGTYGRWAGVNWVWSLFLTLFHAVFSIAIPILLVELLFPARRDQPWVGRRGMVGFSLLFLADVVFGFFVLNPYRPPAVPYLLAITVTAALVLVARRLPREWGAPQAVSVPRPRWFALLGFGATLAFFLLHWVLPHAWPPVPITVSAAIVLVVLVGWAIRRMSGGGAWRDEHRLALVGGALMFLVLLAPLQELDPNRADSPAGMTLVGLAALAFLFGLWRWVRRSR